MLPAAVCILAPGSTYSQRLLAQLKQWHSAVFIPGYSGGTAAACTAFLDRNLSVKERTFIIVKLKQKRVNSFSL
jgi:hypothetical protein